MTAATPPYHVTFTITVDGFVEFLRWRQRSLNIAGAVAAILLIAFNLSSLAVGTPLAFALLFSVPAALLLVAVVTPWFDRWRVRRVARSMLGTAASFDIGPTGIEAQQADTTSHLDWSGITRVIDNGKVVVALRDRMPVLWIPASAFNSDSDRVEIVIYMRNAISAAP